MRKARKAAAKRLYEIAEVQNGFFTTKQAKAAGFAENTHPYNSKIPCVLVLHFADLPQSDIGVVHGVRVTRPMRTILDVLAGGEMPLATLRQALLEGLRRGVIRRSEITEARKHHADRTQLQTFFQNVAA